MKVETIYRTAWPLRVGSAMVLAAMLMLGAANSRADEGTIALGGKLYDKWFKVTKAPTPKDTHMAWPSSNTKKKGNATHRCKSCHGWDLMGKDGAYATGSYKTGISGLRGFAGGDSAKVIAAMKDKTHGFDGKMDDGAMGAIAMFVTKGQVDMDKFIDRKSKKAMGDTTKGKAYYVTLCANCHGADGKLPKDLEAPLGKLSAGNPWEILHKILNGQPGGTNAGVARAAASSVSGCPRIFTDPAAEVAIRPPSRGGAAALFRCRSGLREIHQVHLGVVHCAESPHWLGRDFRCRRPRRSVVLGRLQHLHGIHQHARVLHLVP